LKIKSEPLTKHFGKMGSEAFLARRARISQNRHWSALYDSVRSIHGWRSRSWRKQSM